MTTEKPKNRLNPIKETISTIRGYPSRLVVYKITASRFYWVRYYYLGRYHIKSPSAFYSASDQWEVTPSAGAGTPDQALAQSTVTDNQGNTCTTNITLVMKWME